MKPFRITNFTKAMLYVTGRKPSVRMMRRLLIEHVIFYTRNVRSISETEIYVEIERIWKMPEDKVVRKFERAMKGSLVI